MTYSELLEHVRRGNHVPLECVQAVLSAAGKTSDAFLADLFSCLTSAKPGDVCSCGGKLRVVNTRVIGQHRIRYLACGSCGQRPAKNKQITLLESVPTL